MIDTLVALEPTFRNAGTAARFCVRPGEFILVTLHRPAITDDPAFLASVLRELAHLTRELPVLLSVHPRTRAAIGSTPVEGVLLLEPLGYVEFLSLEATAPERDNGLGRRSGDHFPRRSRLHAARQHRAVRDSPPEDEHRHRARSVRDQNGVRGSRSSPAGESATPALGRAGGSPARRGGRHCCRRRTPRCRLGR
jgi:hypothetical protein